MEDVKSLRRNMVMSIVGLLLFLVSVTGVTYAWFTLSGRAHTNVTPMGGAVGDGDALLSISSSHSGPFDRTCSLVYAGDADALKPLSTADLDDFFRVVLQNKQGMALSYENATSRVDQDTMHGTVYLKCEGRACDIYWNPDRLRLGSDPQALAAMRLGMKITSQAGTDTYIMKLDSLGNTSGAGEKLTVPKKDTVVSAVSDSGSATYVKDPASDVSQYMAKTAGKDRYSAGQERLLHLEAGEIASAEYWLYLEGCDAACINSVQKVDSDVMLAFAGVSTD